MTVAASILFFGGAYLLILTQIPRIEQLPVSSAIDLNLNDDANDSRDRIQIEKINLEVPYFTGDASSLEKGAWWRFPERGNPQDGGNFILSAHRFNLGLTPQGTRARSPFYNLGEMQAGDKIRIFNDGKWYDYVVTKNYSVDRNAVEIEAETAEPRLTLYTCSLKGEADGRVVIEAKPLFESSDTEDVIEAEGSPLL